MEEENQHCPIRKKGELGGECARRACQKKDANYYNRSTRQYYCAECAEKINSAQFDVHDANPKVLCTPVLHIFYSPQQEALRAMGQYGEGKDQYHACIYEVHEPSGKFLKQGQLIPITSAMKTATPLVWNDAVYLGRGVYHSNMALPYFGDVAAASFPGIKKGKKMATLHQMLKSLELDDTSDPVANERFQRFINQIIDYLKKEELIPGDLLNLSVTTAPASDGLKVIYSALHFYECLHRATRFAMGDVAEKVARAIAVFYYG